MLVGLNLLMFVLVLGSLVFWVYCLNVLIIWLILIYCGWFVIGAFCVVCKVVCCFAFKRFECGCFGYVVGMIWFGLWGFLFIDLGAVSFGLLFELLF